MCFVEQELTETKLSLSELQEQLRAREVELNSQRVEMQALSESRSEHVNSILTLDESLALEQQTRLELERVMAELQVESPHRPCPGFRRGPLSNHRRRR